MDWAATADAAGGKAALAAKCTMDEATLARVVAGLKAGMAGVNLLSRHEDLCLPAADLERRTVTGLLRLPATRGTRP